MTKGATNRLAKDPKMRRRRQAISDPTRMRIMGLVLEYEGLTAKELGEKLRIDPNRLYYHLRILEDVGVIEATELRATGRNTERVYKQCYDGRYIWDAEDPVELATYMASQLEVTKIEGEECLFEQAERVKKGEEPPVVVWGRPATTTSRDEIKEFHKRLDALLDEFRQRAKAIRSEEGHDLKRLRFTWVLCEQAVPEVAASESIATRPNLAKAT